MTKLTELEKQKVITCVGYIEGKFRCDRYKQEFSSLTCFGKYKTKKDCQAAIDNKKEVM